MVRRRRGFLSLWKAGLASRNWTYAVLKIPDKMGLR
jgi:hypothetical protein